MTSRSSVGVAIAVVLALGAPAHADEPTFERMTTSPLIPHLVILAMFCTHMVHNLAKITKFWDGRTDPGRFAKPY